VHTIESALVKHETGYNLVNLLSISILLVDTMLSKLQLNPVNNEDYTCMFWISKLAHPPNVGGRVPFDVHENKQQSFKKNRAFA
jgi:hypothetical protein